MRIFFLLFLLVGCIQQSKLPLESENVPADITISLLTITPSSSMVSPNNIVEFRGIGGNPPYTYSVVSGFGSINSEGLFTAPSSSGSTTVRVTDSAASSAFALVTTISSLSLNPTNAVVQTNQSYTFSAAGGVYPYTFRILSGTGSVSSSGVYTSSNVTGNSVVEVSDASGNKAFANISVQQSLTLSPATAIVEDLKTVNFTATGGTAPYTYSVYAGGGSINPSTGVFLAPATNGNVIIRAHDANGFFTEAIVSVKSGPDLSVNYNKVPVSKTLQVISENGTLPITYSVLSGGGSINSTGLYTAPATPGMVTVRGMDANGFYQDLNFEVFIPTRVSIGAQNICMVRVNSDGVTSESKCWGHNQWGQIATKTATLGDDLSDMGDNLKPVQLGTSQVPIAIYGSYYHRFCVLMSTGILKCFGNNQNGSAGLSATTTHGFWQNTMGDKLPFVNLGTNVTVTNTLPISDRVAMGQYHSCAITSGGGLKCWGLNTSGQLGLGDLVLRCSAPTNCGNSLPFVNLGGEQAIQVVTGVAHTCVLLSPSLRVKCWGANSYGQLGYQDTAIRGGAPTSTPDLLSYVNLGTIAATPVKVKRIAAGAYATCAILENNSVKCWGYNHQGQLGHQNAVTRGGNVGDMGDNLAVTQLSTTKIPKDIVSSVYHSCVIFTDDTLKCWGNNTFGQLGLGDVLHRGDQAGEMGDSLPFINLGTGEKVAKVSMAYHQTCVLTQSQKIKCWGRNLEGNLGLGDLNNRGDTAGEMGDSLPAVNLSSSALPEDIATTEGSQCAILDNDTVKCWGFEFNHGSLGHEVGSVGMYPTEKVPLIAPIDFGAGIFAKDSYIGHLSSCFQLMDNSLRCYGYNQYGELGIGSVVPTGLVKDSLGSNSAQPLLGTGFDIAQLAMAIQTTCALSTTGVVKCWGYGVDGRHGQGHGLAYGDSALEVGDNMTSLDFGADTVKSIHAGGNHFCSVFTDNSVKCWGNNTSGSLGIGDTAHRGHTVATRPVNIPKIDLGTGRTVKQLSAGQQHTCAILDNDKVKCWGLNLYGQLGYEDTNNRGDVSGEMGDNLPYVDLGSNLTPEKITLGVNHSCVLFTNKKVKCWGYNEAFGTLGVGDTLRRGNVSSTMGDNLPFVNYSATRRAIDIVANGYNTCVILEDNSFKCWGDNSTGKLGQGHGYHIGSDPVSMGRNLPSY